MTNNISRTKESIQNILIFFTDAIAIVLSYYIAGIICLHFYWGIDGKQIFTELSDDFISIMVATVITAIFYNVRNDFVSRGYFEEFKSVVCKCAAFAAVMAVYELLRRDVKIIPRGTYIATIFIAVVLMYISRVLVKLYLRSRNESKKATRVIMVSVRNRAQTTLSNIDEKDDWLRRIDGIVIMDEDMTGEKINGVPVVANIHTMMKYIKNEIVDEVYIDVTDIIRERIKPMVMELEDMGVTVHLKLEILDKYRDFDAKLGYLGNIPVVTFANRMYSWKALFVKRCMDIAGAVIGLVVMGIAMIFVAPAIKIESKGPLFFKQKRVGKNGRYFYIYKFRSMYIDAEERKKELLSQNEMNGLMFKMKDDPRITKVGKFIRATSIDELPQFINVLKGDMSLVGTRPPTVAEFKQYKGHHKRRLSMKPGITGMWQAYGRNSVMDFEDIVKMDLEYIDNWSVLLDIKILFKTIATVFVNRGT